MMLSFLKEVGSFALGQLFEAGVDGASEAVSSRTMLCADDAVRAYLSKNTSPQDYEKMDAFLAEQGVYASDQMLENNAHIKEITTELVEQFYEAHPELRHKAAWLTLQLEQAIAQCCRTMFQQLSREGRILYQQNARGIHLQQQQSRNMEKMQEALADLKSAQHMLTAEKVLEIYQRLIAAIADGEFALAGSVLDLMEPQLAPTERFYGTACRIRLHFYLHGLANFSHACERLLRENPYAEILHDTVTFLIQSEDMQALGILAPAITEHKLRKLAQMLLEKTHLQQIQLLTGEDHRLKEEYAGHIGALWALGNALLHCGNACEAHRVFLEIEAKEQSFWVR